MCVCARYICIIMVRAKIVSTLTDTYKFTEMERLLPPMGSRTVEWST